jgi:hypothetical protein
MTQDVRHALATLAGPAPAEPADPGPDLARATAALRRRTARRVRLGGLGVAAACVLGVTAAGLAGGVGGAGGGRGPASAADAGPRRVELVAAPLDVAPYVFDLTPRGWSVQGQTPSAVTIAPDGGGVSDNPDDFRGKLVIMYDLNPVSGRRVERDGRTFWVRGDADYTTVSTMSRAGEPAGVVLIQYPDDAGWDLDAMLDFLGSVHVTENAQPGLG